MEKLYSLNKYNLRILNITVMLFCITLFSFFIDNKILLTSIFISQIIGAIFIWFLIKKSEEIKLEN